MKNFPSFFPNSVRQRIYSYCSSKDLLEKICLLNREDYFNAIETILFDKSSVEEKIFQVKFLRNLLNQSGNNNSLLRFKGSQNYENFIKKAQAFFMNKKNIPYAYKFQGLTLLAFLKGFKLPQELFRQILTSQPNFLASLSPLLTYAQLNQIYKKLPTPDPNIVSNMLDFLLPHFPAPTRENIINKLISQGSKNTEALIQSANKLASSVVEISSSPNTNFSDLIFDYSLPVEKALKAGEFTKKVHLFVKETKSAIAILQVLQPFISQLSPEQHQALIKIILQWLKNEGVSLLILKNTLPFVKQLDARQRDFIGSVPVVERDITTYQVFLGTLTKLVTHLTPEAKQESIALIFQLLKIKDLVGRIPTYGPLTLQQQEFIETILDLKDQESIQLSAIGSLKALAPYLTLQQQEELFKPIIKGLENSSLIIDDNELQILVAITPYLPIQRQKELVILINNHLVNSKNGNFLKDLLRLSRTLVPYFNSKNIKEFTKMSACSLSKLLKNEQESIRVETIKTFIALINYLNIGKQPDLIAPIFQALEDTSSKESSKACEDMCLITYLLPFAHRLDQQKLCALIIKLANAEQENVRTTMLLAFVRLLPALSLKNRQEFIKPITQLLPSLLKDPSPSIRRAALKAFKSSVSYYTFDNYQECIDIILEFFKDPQVMETNGKEAYKDAFNIINQWPQKQQLKEILMERLKKSDTKPLLIDAIIKFFPHLSLQEQQDFLKFYTKLFSADNQSISQLLNSGKKLIPYLNTAAQREIIKAIINLIAGKISNEVHVNALKLLTVFPLEILQLERDKFVEKIPGDFWLEIFLRISEYLNKPDANQELNQDSSAATIFC